MNTLLRRSAAPALRRTLAAMLACELPIFASLESPVSGYFSNIGDLGQRLGFRRDFHFSSVPREFRFSAVTRAEYAVDDSPFWEDERSKGATDEGLEIAKLGIAREIVSSLAHKGITRLFPIQRAVLEPAMQGRDMIGRARTGTGKTLAFGIPIMDKIIQHNTKNGCGKNPLAIILAPTRELAKQVEKEFKESGGSLHTLCVYGGSPIGQQMRALNYGVDVVVGTPGRVIDLLGRGALNLREVKFVVLDEADQMLNVGFKEDVERIMENLPEVRQTMLFSATMPAWIRNLTRAYLKNPVTIDLVGDSDQKLAEGISLYAIVSDNYGKASIVGTLITDHAKGGKCIVFTQTKRDADRLAYFMARTHKCEALHGDISQNQRERTLAGFREGRFNILVATDVAARGLDIPNVDLVIHYELPTTSEIFVHRSGRTGRAGKKGNTILIYSEQQYRTVRQIEQDIGSKFSELPKIKGEGGADNFFADMRGGSDSSFGGGRGGGGFGRSGSYGGGSSGSSRYDGGFGGRSGGFGNRAGSSRESGSGGFGSFGGGSTSSNRYGGGGSFGNSGGYGGGGSRFGNSGGYGSGSSSSFGNSGGYGGGGSNGGYSGSGYSGRSGSGSDFGRSRGSNSFSDLGTGLFDNAENFGSGRSS